MYANQGTKIWYLCYHSSKIPATSFVHVDPPESRASEITGNEKLPRTVPLSTSASVSQYHRTSISESGRSTSRGSGRSVNIYGQPRANSTILESCQDCESDCSRNTSHHPNSRASTEHHSMCQTEAGTVGDMSHIPRVAPSRTTYIVPCIESNNTNTVGTICDPGDDLFGMIKLKENDVCYTSGTIEWVGRKRSFPINSGFKLLTESHRHEPLVKKVKTLDATYTFNGSHMKDCDCADVLPTVNAIVDHLNALHEAVDLVDLRVNTLENTM